MMTLKAVGAFAVIVGCFAVVYPRFLHPLVMRALGMHETPVKEEDTHFPPHMRHNHPSLMERKAPPMPHDTKDMRQHMRPGPHPGMRAAAEMQKQQAGSGRGMMGIVLPMYAIGICVYLVYTLFKVFNKRGKYSDPYSSSSVNKHGHYADEGERDRMGFPKDMSGYEGAQGYDDSEVQRFLRQKQQERELEDLLGKMDDTHNVSEDEMRALQKRLEETEAQMTRILQAMQTMQSRVSTMGGEGVGDGGAACCTGDRPAFVQPATEDSGTKGRAEGVAETVGLVEPATSSSEDSQKESHDTETSASSPDTESFEVVKKNTTGINASDLSPASEVSSLSSFEQIHRAGEEETEEDGGCEEIIPEREEQETPSNVRHRKTAQAEED